MMMSKLESYYSHKALITNTNSSQSDINSQMWDGLEDELIREEVMPELMQKIAPVLAKVKTPLSININYNPEGFISINFSRNCLQMQMSVNGITQDAQKHLSTNEETGNALDEGEDTEQVSENTEEQSEEEVKSHKVVRSARKKFKVIFNGEEIIGDGTTVLAKAIQKIGFNRVAKLGIMMAKGEYNLVSRHKREEGNVSWQREIDGWYIYSNTQNPTKIEQLRYIAKELSLDLKVVEESSAEEETEMTNYQNKPITDEISAHNKYHKQ